MRGAIKSAWHIEDDSLALRVTIPANTTATIYLPAMQADGITKGDIALFDASGVESAAVIAR